MSPDSNVIEPFSPDSDLLPIRGERWQGVRYGCTTRLGGVSSGHWESFNLGLHAGDDPEAVRENRRRLAAALPGEPFWLEQVHGIQVVDADAWSEPGAAADGMADTEAAGAKPSGAVLLPRADAAVTMQPGRVLAIMTADCVPVVIADTEGRALGVAHAGWRGLAAGVLESLFAVLQARLPVAMGWRAWIGPCIGQASYEVGDEVRQAFVGVDHGAAPYFASGMAQGKWQADLALLTQRRLDMMDIYNVELSGLCTHQRPDLFYSYRRSTVTGRMATLAWLEQAPQT